MGDSTLIHVKSLFQQALDLPDEARNDFLRKACGSDRDLRQRVQQLLDHMQVVPDEFLDGRNVDLSGLDASLTNQIDENDDLLGIPEKFGEYEIVRLVGIGGMGAVYEARQLRPQRIVALKILRPGLMGRERTKRFEREADLLGRLQHPFVARVFEVGVANTPSGKRPYLTMEFIDGWHLDEWSAQPGRTNEERLNVLAKICDAVQHAHDCNIIHRDLKPSNLLIDRQGAPKVLDFGVARLVGGEDKRLTFETMDGQLVGTLPYMSPEQVTGKPGSIDRRCDVYSLGVILYELLTGNLPIDVREHPLTEAARRIQEEEPAPLSQFDHSLRGDLEIIVATALEKDRNRRYPSAGALGAELNRFCTHEPIHARPLSTIYRIRKFTKRNKALVGGIAATFVALLLGLTLATAGFISASRERDAARLARDAKQEALVAKQKALDEKQEALTEKQEALLKEQSARNVSEAVTDFLAEMLAAASPSDQRRDITVREVVDKSAQNIAEQFGTKPEVERRLRDTIGQTYLALGAYPEAEQQFRALINLVDGSASDEESNQLLVARKGLSVACYHQGRIEEAADVLLEIANSTLAQYGPDDSRLVAPMCNAAYIMMKVRRYDEAERLFTSAVSIQERSANPDEAALLDTKMNLAGLYAYMNQKDQAVNMYRSVIAGYTRLFGPDYERTIVSTANLATLLPYDEQLPMLEDALKAQIHQFDRSHPQTLIALYNLAVLLRDHNRVDEGRDLLLTGLELANATYGPGHSSTKRFSTKIKELGILP